MTPARSKSANTLGRSLAGEWSQTLTTGVRAFRAASARAAVARARTTPDEAAGGPGGGVKAMNDNLPINPSVLVGGQNWFDNVVTMTRVDGPLPDAI